MGLGLIEEKNLNDVIAYALDYPNVVLVEAQALVPDTTMLCNFSYGLYVGYISGYSLMGF